MLFAEVDAATQVVLLGVLGVGLACALRWRASLTRRLRNATAAAAGDAPDRSETHGSGATRGLQLDQFEVRLHEYSRDVESRMETRLAQLDRLVVSADREICRLQDLLQKNRQPQQGPDVVAGDDASPTDDAAPQREPLTPWQRRMVVHLRDAGYRALEISVLLDRPESEIQRAIDFERQSEPRDAA